MRKVFPDIFSFWNNRLVIAVVVIVMLLSSTIAVSAHKFDVKFLLTDPSDNKTSYFEKLKNDIKEAKKSIHFDIYLLEYNQYAGKDYPPNKILNELVKAKNRGVDVRMTINPATSARYPDTEPFLIKNGLAYKLTGTHSKLAVIDDRIAYVGSLNWNWRGLKYNYETNVRTMNPDVIKQANAFLDNKWERGSAVIPATTDSSEKLLTGRGYFKDVQRQLANATNTIEIIMYDAQYNTKSKDFPTILLDELLNAKNRGVNVKILLDDETSTRYPNTIKFLKDNNITFKLDQDGTIVRHTEMLKFMASNNIHDKDTTIITHSKMLIIDDFAYIGSHNWTLDGLDTGGDATLKLNDPHVLSDSVHAFNDAWKRARTI